MAITLVKPTDTLSCPHPTIMIYSAMPGIGRTSLGYMTRKGLLADFDRGAHRAGNRKDTLQVDTWADMLELLDSPVLENYQEFVVDTVGRLLDVMGAGLIRDNPKNAQGDGTLSLKGWGALRMLFISTLDRLRARGLDVILVAHGKEEKDGDVTIMRPDIQGGSYSEVHKQADLIGFLTMRGRDRIIDFSPNERWIGKNPGNWPPIKVPNYGADGQFLSGLLDKAREALGRVSEESAAAAAEVDKWRADIASYDTPEKATAVLPAVKAVEPMIVREQVKRILADHCKASGWEYDKDASVFKKAPKKKAAPAAETKPLAQGGEADDPEAAVLS